MIMQSVLVVAGLSLAFGLGLAYFARKFYTHSDPRVNRVRKVLPGVNCGACGLAGCDAFAEAVAEGKAPVDGCVPGQKEVADKIAKILGKETTLEKKKMVAQLHCNGTIENCGSKFYYKGAETCKAASLLLGGFRNCSYACLQFGDCVEACPFGAIKMKENGLPEVDKEKCVGCGTCVAACPKGLYELVPEAKKVHVLCSSKDLNKVVVKACRVGCIACRACEKACPADAIHVEDHLAVIDYSKCINCAKCVSACPRKIIKDDRKI